MADSTTKINKGISRDRAIHSLPGVVFYRVVLCNAGLVILVMHEDVMPARAFWLTTPRTPVAPGWDFHENTFNVHVHTAAIEYVVIDALSRDEFSLFHAEPR
jgi:hypothetical protein